MTTANRSGAMIEKPVRLDAAAKPTIDRVFVSPRVVDEQAFQDFSSELRGLLEEVRGVQHELERSGAQAEAAAKTLTGSKDKYRQHLELTTKLLKALSAKSSEAEKTLELLNQRVAQAKEAEHSAASALEAKVSGFERSLEERLKRAEEAYEKRLVAMESRFETQRSRFEQILSTLEEHLSERVETHRSAMDTMISERIGGIEAEVERRSSGLGETVLTRLEAGIEAAELAAANLETKRQEVVDRTGESLDQVLDQLHDACGIATKLVGWDPSDPGSDPGTPTQGSLGDLLQRAVKTKDDAEWSIRRLGSLRDQAKEAIDELGESFEGSVSLLDQLHTQRKRMDGELGTVLERVEAFGSNLQQREQRIEGLLSPLNEAVDRAEAALRELCGCATGTAEVIADAQISRHALGEMLASTRELAERLEPWRETMLGTTAPGELPKPLAAVVERFESELGRDLGALADTIESLMHREGSAATDQR